LGTQAIFVGRKRFAVLDKTHQIVVKNLKNEETKRFTLPMNADMMFSAPAGMLLLRSEDKITLYEVAQKKIMAEINVTEIKMAY